MRIIQTLHDLEVLKSACVLDNRYIEHLQNYFKNLMEEFRESESEEDFSLEQFGYIILIEKGDNCTNLQFSGLHRIEGGLVGSYPEFVNTVHLKDINGSQKEIIIYHVFVLFDNEFGMNYFLKAGKNPPNVEKWLIEQSIE